MIHEQIHNSIHDERAAGRIRVLGVLNGNIHDPAGDARIKYGQLFAALARCCDLLDVRDVELRGLDRYQSAVRTLRWPKQRWREAFYKNIWAFQQRTRRTQQLVRQYHDRCDVIFQHGALFSAGLDDGPPVVLYADFTHRLAQREDHWREPFTNPAESERWNELERQAYRRAAFVLTRSEHTRTSMIDDYGIAAERVVAVGGGCNFDTLPSAAPPVAAPRVLFIGRDFERKGGDLLVAAFARVRAALPDAELWLVTDSTHVAGPGVRRIAPIYDRAAIAALYRAAGVFAMPSRCETWGDVFLEAMAYGLPCVGAASDAMPEIILDGETGYIVAPDDVAGLAGALVRLLGDATLRQRMGACGRARVASLFTWDHVAQRILPYLERACAARTVRGIPAGDSSPALAAATPEHSRL